jgi:hypothetical protein
VLAIKRGFTIKAGDKSFGINNLVDKKITQSRITELHDRELQNSLYSQALKIDANGTAKMKRVIRDIDDDITAVFGKYTKCSFPATEIYRFISSELFQRIEDNNLREKFSQSEREGYISDIEYKIKTKYENFFLRVNDLTCGESYPEWGIILPEVHNMVSKWAQDETLILAGIIREKLNMYDENKSLFTTDGYRKSAIEIPTEKNMTYLANLGIKR